jgi:hypothetical protein
VTIESLVKLSSLQKLTGGEFTALDKAAHEESRMLEEIMEAAMGPWGIAAAVLLLMPGSRKMARTVTKEVIRAGMTVTDNVKDLLAEVKEEASDVVAEVRAERQSGTTTKAAKETAHSHKSHE